MQMLRIYVDTIKYHIRPNHTDWECLFELEKITQYEQDLEWYYPQRTWHTIVTNLKYVRTVLRARSPTLRRRLSVENPHAGRLDNAELDASGCNVIYCHSEFPGNATLPVLWRSTILDPEMQIARGHSPNDIAREAEQKQPLFAKSQLVQVASRAEQRRLATLFPDLTEKFTYIPYFLPHLTPLTDEALARKCADDIVRIVFIGRHGRRKGLDLFLQAAEIARLNYRSDVEIVVVSALDDGVIPIPTWSNLRHYRGLPRAGVMGLLEKAHVFVMPSRFESYGIVYVEALSKAAIPIVPNWEVQSELVDYGRAGVAVPLDPAAIAHSLIRLIEDVSYRHALAHAAVARARKEYVPRVVAQLYANALRTAAV